MKKARLHHVKSLESRTPYDSAKAPAVVCCGKIEGARHIHNKQTLKAIIIKMTALFWAETLRCLFRRKNLDVFNNCFLGF